MQVNIDSPKLQDPEEYEHYSRRHHHTVKFGDTGTSQHVYRTMRNSKELKIPLSCHTKYDKIEQSAGPCLCQHCGMVGLISESQKYPIVAHTPEPKELFKKQPTYRQEKVRHLETNIASLNEKQMAYLNSLAERVRILEERLEVQEEKAVPKEYFKRIITKIVTHFSLKTAKLQNELATPKVECTTRGAGANDDAFCPLVFETHETSHYYQPRQNVSSPFKNKKNNFTDPPSRHVFKDSNLTTDSSSEDYKHGIPKSESFWKWGGEILRPGIDLKNKILSLLEITFSKFSKNFDEGSTASKHNERKHHDRRTCSPQDGKKSQTNFKKETFEYCFGYENDKYSHFNNADTGQYDIFRPLDVPESIKNKPSPRFCHPNTKEGATRYNEFEKKSTKPSMIPKPLNTPKREVPHSKAPKKPSNNGEGTNINVAYINPKLASWREESSSASVKGEYPDESPKVHVDMVKEAEKNEFLKTLSRTKDSDKERLWQSIWNQAQLNGQSKNDKVTIQIPKQYRYPSGQDETSAGDIIEIEFTIADLESMLTKRK